MKKKIAWLVAGLFLFGGTLYAASGDLIVNGNLGIGTASPGAKLDIKADGTHDNNSCQFRIIGTDTNKQLMIGFDTTNNYGWIQPVFYGNEYKNLGSVSV